MRLSLSLLAALLAGAMTVYGFAPYRLYWLLPLSLAVLAELAQRNSNRAFLLGYSWGMGAYTANFYWIYHSLYAIAGVPAWLAIPITALLPAYLALYPGVAIWASCRLCSHYWVRWLLAFPAFWTLTEWLRGWILTGFPWGQVGYSQITESPLAGFATVGGIYTVTFIVALYAGLLVLLARANLRVRIILLIIATLIGSCGSWLKEIKWTKTVGKPFSIALAQGNIRQNIKWDRAYFVETLTLYYTQVANTHADLMILPETALPVFLDELPSGYLSMLIGSAQRRSMALAAGIPLRTNDKQGYLNAVVALTSDTMPYYAKNHLVPLSEFIPLRGVIGWLYQYINMPLADFTPGGTYQAPLAMAGQKIAFNICYEDSFGEELITTAKEATLLVNVSNLAWFGKSQAQSQHLQISQARAIETGRFVIRSTNTGSTAIIRPDGEIVSIAAPYTRQVLIGFAEGREGVTPYMRYGNLPILLIALCILFVATILERQSDRSRYTRL